MFSYSLKGHSENLDLEDSNFVLRNLTETRTMKANDVKIDGNQFVCRFNVAILDMVITYLKISTY